MHFPITLLLYIINMSFLLSQRLESAASHNPDEPSPEWIKYQQERFEHNAKTQIFQNSKELKDPLNSKREVNVKHQDNEATSSRHSGNYNHQQEQYEFERPEQTETPQFTNSLKFPSIKGFVEFLKSLKQTWMKNSIFHIDDKIKLLQNLKDSLFKTIEKQFMVLWHNDEEDDHHVDVDIPNHHIRRKRGILDESNINFPPYAALMSINFLTFSVFLIKLVLQVVNIIKSKHYQLSAYNMMNTGGIRNMG